MYKLSFKPSDNQSISTLLLMGLLIIVSLSFGLTSSVTVFDSKSTQENLSDQSDLSSTEMEDIANMDFDCQPEISKELRENIATTMNGFNTGFRENPNVMSESKYLLSSSQMGIQFSQSQVQLRIPNFDPSVMTSEIASPDQIVNFDPNVNPLETRMTDDRGQSIGPKLLGYTVATLEFVGSNQVLPIAENPSASYFNYFYGSDPDKWIVNVPSYGKLLYKNLYDNIDLVYTLKEGQLKYDFYVYPGGNYEDIQLRWDGRVSFQQTSEGLKISVSSLFGEQSFVDSNPVNFVGTDLQEKVSGSFRTIDEQTYGFSIDIYDRSEVLVIDPILYFSTFLGGTGNEYGSQLVIDDNDDVYVTGRTSSTDFPTTTGVYNETYNGGLFDVFVTKLAADGSTLLYSTYFGGSGDDQGNSLAIDITGNVYITGVTGSFDFPTTTGSSDETKNGVAFDVFVVKLAADGSTLLYSTFVGGSSADYGYSLAIDTSNNVYITGYTASTDFPTSLGAYDRTFNGGNDVFVSKLSADGSTLLYSTFLGGSATDWGYSLVVDGNGDVYITGFTQDDITDFPTTPSAYDETHNGGVYDVFVSKLAADGSTLLYSTFLGGSSADYGYSLAIDTPGNVYITGFTGSINFPTSLGAYDDTYNGENDMFVSKLASDGSILLFSTFFGGSATDRGNAVTVDGIGNVYITGYTTSTEFPTTPDAIDETKNGAPFDVFVVKLAGNGSTLLYSTFLGGSGADYGISLAVGKYGDMYIAGFTASTDFPTTAGAYGESNNGVNDVFVTKISLRPGSPTNVQSFSKANGYGSFVFLVWDQPHDDASTIDEYFVYRGTSSGMYTSIGGTFGNRTYFNDTYVIENQAYYYVVSAKNQFGESRWSSEYSIILRPAVVATETETSFITDTETKTSVITETKTSIITKTETETTVSSQTKTEKTYFPMLPVVMLIIILPILRRRISRN